MHTIESLTAALLAADKNATAESVRAYLERNIEILGFEEAAKRTLARLEAYRAAKAAKKPRRTDKPVMIRDSYKGRPYYRRADASEIHDMI